MASNFKSIALSKRNPFLMVGRNGTHYMGQMFPCNNRIIDFNDTTMGVRAFFSWLRFIQRRKSVITVGGVLDNIDWLDSQQNFGLQSKVYANSGLSAEDPFDYHLPTACTLAIVLAKALTDIDLRDDVVQTAQKMIL